MVLFELLKKFKGFPFYVVLLGLINSLFYTCILVLISRILSDGSMLIAPVPNWLVFCLLVTLAYFSSKIFQTYMIKATHRIIYEFEINLLEQVRGSSYADLERIGKNKILSAVEDTRVIGEAPEIFINTFNAIIIILSCLGYIYTVSWQGGMCILAVMLLLIVVYLKQNKSIERQLNVLRDNQNNYYRYMYDLLQGFKEVRMSIRRNETIFHEYLKLNRIDGRDIGISARLKDLNNELLGNLSWYVVIGLIMYLLPVVLRIDKEHVNALVMAVLYMMGPVSTLIMFIYHYTRVKIAFQRLKVLENEVQVLPLQPGTAAIKDETEHVRHEFHSLRVEGVSYQYVNQEHGTTFTLEPVSLEIRKGETIFVTGGNGSGKSTFMNLLTGLYRPHEGNIYLNEERITDDNLTWYSNQISVVFSDFYLFSENYNKFDLSENNTSLKSYSSLMKMRDVIRFNQKKNKIEANFSRGQQKRMALIYCLLENRDLFVLDEWASEQDPVFRNYFYTQVLPVLKAQGKTIIAVTHDDQYFRYADRILEFDYGKLIHDRDLAAVSQLYNA